MKIPYVSYLITCECIDNFLQLSESNQSFSNPKICQSSEMFLTSENFENNVYIWDTVQNTCIDVKPFMKMGKYI